MIPSPNVLGMSSSTPTAFSPSIMLSTFHHEVYGIQRFQIPPSYQVRFLTMQHSGAFNPLGQVVFIGLTVM